MRPLCISRSEVVYEDADAVSFGAYLKHRKVERWTLEGALHKQEWWIAWQSNSEISLGTEHSICDGTGSEWMRKGLEEFPSTILSHKKYNVNVNAGVYCNLNIAITGNLDKSLESFSQLMIMFCLALVSYRDWSRIFSPVFLQYATWFSDCTYRNLCSVVKCLIRFQEEKNRVVK